MAFHAVKFQVWFPGMKQHWRQATEKFYVIYVMPCSSWHRLRLAANILHVYEWNDRLSWLGRDLKRSLDKHSRLLRQFCPHPSLTLRPQGLKGNSVTFCSVYNPYRETGKFMSWFSFRKSPFSHKQTVDRSWIPPLASDASYCYSCFPMLYKILRHHPRDRRTLWQLIKESFRRSYHCIMLVLQWRYWYEAVPGGSCSSCDY